MVANPAGECEPAHIGQLDAGKNQFHRLFGAMKGEDRRSSVRKFDHMIAAVAQVIGGCGADDCIVVDDKDRW